MKLYALIALLLGAGFRTQAAVELAPTRIEEVRTVTFVDDKVSRTPASLKLVLSLSGPEAESSVRYGNVKLEEAVDDKGASLIPTKDTFHDATRFKDYANAFFRKSGFGPKSAPQVELDLALPARAAMKIARLRGSLELAEQGTIRTVELTGLKGSGKKALPMPPAAGVGISVSVGSGEAIRSVAIEITGDEGAVESIEIEDASGHKVSNGMSSWSMNGGPVQKTLGLSKPLDDSMKVVAKIAVDRKITKVPFDLRNIALP